MDDFYMPDEPREAFYLAVAEALNQCQSLEMAVKRHIGASFEAARKYIDGRIIFALDDRDFDKRSLGQLIDVYSKLTKDVELVKELREFVSERNFLAHRAISECYLPDGTFAPSNSEGLTERIEQIRKTAENLDQRVYDAGGLVLAHVWFDDLTKTEGNG